VQVSGEVVSVEEIQEQTKEMEEAKEVGLTAADIVAELLPFLAEYRYHDEPSWLDIGRAFAHSSKHSAAGLKLWKQAGEDHSRDVSKCDTQYASFCHGVQYITERTIGWYAMKDAEERYWAWHKTWTLPAIRRAIECPTDDNLAKVMYHLCWLSYFFDGKDWWYFNDHHLEKDTKNMEMRIVVSQFLQPTFEAHARQCQEELKTYTGTDEDKEKYTTAIKEIWKLAMSLGSNGKKNGIIIASELLCYVKGFAEKCDSNALCTGWGNCVIECGDARAFPRHGKPEDYITIYSSTAYDDKLTDESPLVIEVMTCIRMIMTTLETREYFLKDVASMLLGRNGEKIFRVWSGDTDAGKSIIIKMLASVFGKYLFDFPANLLCEAARVNGPSPELAQAKGGHIGVISEAGLNMVAELVKRYTGGDRFFARNLHENGGSIEAFFKLVYICNKIATIKDEDQATRNRFRVTPFKSKFVDNPTEGKREFKKDAMFDQRIPYLTPAFLWIIVKYYAKYRAEGLTPPQEVREATDGYWSDTDMYITYIHDRIDYARVSGGGEIDMKAGLSGGDLFPDFTAWHRNQFPSRKVPDSSTFRAEMMRGNRLGVQGQYKKWYGIRLRPQVVTPAMNFVQLAAQ